MGSVFADFTKVGKEPILILVETAFQPWMLSIFSIECNFLNVIDVIFPVWKEILA